MQTFELSDVQTQRLRLFLSLSSQATYIMFISFLCSLLLIRRVNWTLYSWITNIIYLSYPKANKTSYETAMLCTLSPNELYSIERARILLIDFNKAFNTFSGGPSERSLFLSSTSMPRRTLMMLIWSDLRGMRIEINWDILKLLSPLQVHSSSQVEVGQIEIKYSQQSQLTTLSLMQTHSMCCDGMGPELLIDEHLKNQTSLLSPSFSETTLSSVVTVLLCRRLPVSDWWFVFSTEKHILRTERETQTTLKKVDDASSSVFWLRESVVGSWKMKDNRVKMGRIRHGVEALKITSHHMAMANKYGLK